MKMKRKLTAYAAALALAASLLPMTAFAAEAEITEINSADDLAQFSTSVNEGNTYDGVTVTLNADITLSGEWTPIGNGARTGSSYTGSSFKGTFNGNGKTISGVEKTTTTSADTAVGLFGVVDGGTVKDLNVIVDINVPSSACAGGAIGLLTGGGAASNITVGGNMTVNNGGGIVGRMLIDGTISDCVNNADITASKANVGGIVGAAYYTAIDKEMTIKNCVNNGTITTSAGVAGGIVGLSAANVSNCTNTGAVTSSGGTSVGGIVGEQQSYGAVTGNINSADVKNTTATYGTGGIVGWVRYSGAVSAYPLKKIVEVSGNTNYGSITGGSDGGGIIGTLYNAGVVTENKNYASSISGEKFAAGIVGNFQATETPVGDIPECSAEISNNVSTTALDSISGALKNLYVYTNGNDITVKNNALAQVENFKAVTEADGSTATGFAATITADGSYLLQNVRWNITSGNETKSAVSSFNNVTINGDARIGFIVANLADSSASAALEINE